MPVKCVFLLRAATRGVLNKRPSAHQPYQEATQVQVLPEKSAKFLVTPTLKNICEILLVFYQALP